MPQMELSAAVQHVRDLILSADFHKAVGSGKRHASAPTLQRVDIRPVNIAGQNQIQVVSTELGQYTAPVTKNYSREAVPPHLDDLLAHPFSHWTVTTTTQQFGFRVTKKGVALTNQGPGPGTPAPNEHDRRKKRLSDSVLTPAGDVSSAQEQAWEEFSAEAGGKADKRRQVESFLRILEPSSQSLRAGSSPARPLRMVDLGCGNAYLTFAAHRWMSTQVPTLTVGVDTREAAMQRNTQLANRLDMALVDGPPRTGVHFAAERIAGAATVIAPQESPDIVLALHACDTATDEALAQAIAWQAPLILAAPCCHHDVSAQLKDRWSGGSEDLFAAVGQDGILRERFADTLTDTLRAAFLRLQGYRVDVMEFIDSMHTPRNTLIRAVYTGAAASPRRVREYDELVAALGVDPAIRVLTEQALQENSGPDS